MAVPLRFALREAGAACGLLFVPVGFTAATSLVCSKVFVGGVRVRLEASWVSNCVKGALDCCEPLGVENS